MVENDGTRVTWTYDAASQLAVEERFGTSGFMVTFSLTYVTA